MSRAPFDRSILALDRELAGRRPLLLLGEAPNHATADRPQLWLLPDASGVPHSANRLLELTGLTLEQFVRLFDRDDLVHTPAALSRTAYQHRGRARASAVIERVAHKHVGMVVLGARASSCFTWAYGERNVDGITTTWLVPRGGREPLRTGLVCTVDAGELELKLSSGVWPRDVRFAIAMHVPHPSGRNPQWGANPSLAQRFRDWCRDAFTTHVPR